jgi:phytoene desaturase
LAEIEANFWIYRKGSGKVLNKFITEAKSNYDIVKDLVYRPGVSPLELVTVETTKKVGQFFSNISRTFVKNFKTKG